MASRGPKKPPTTVSEGSTRSLRRAPRSKKLWISLRFSLVLGYSVSGLPSAQYGPRGLLDHPKSQIELRNEPRVHHRRRRQRRRSFLFICPLSLSSPSSSHACCCEVPKSMWRGTGMTSEALFRRVAPRAAFKVSADCLRSTCTSRAADGLASQGGLGRLFRTSS